MDFLVWTATNVVSALILPPGVLFVLLAAGLYWGRRYRWARWLTAGSLVLFVLLSLNAVGYALLKPFEAHWPPLDPSITKKLSPERTVIVVLGGGRRQGAIEYADREALSSASLRRVIYAAQLADQTGLRLGVSGGKPDGGQLSEAALMKNLIEKNLKQPVAFIEEQSLDTRQNAIYMARILAGENIDAVVLVTDVLHMPRAVQAFQATGLMVMPAPMYFQSGSPLTLLDFLPSVQGLENSRYALHEIIGDIWYRLRRLVD